MKKIIDVNSIALAVTNSRLAIEKDVKDNAARWSFTRARINAIRTAYQKQFGGQKTDADYYIFNSLNA
jgi:hypothetical protein